MRIILISLIIWLEIQWIFNWISALSTVMYEIVIKYYKKLSPNLEYLLLETDYSNTCFLLTSFSSLVRDDLLLTVFSLRGTFSHLVWINFSSAVNAYKRLLENFRNLFIYIFRYRLLFELSYCLTIELQAVCYFWRKYILNFLYKNSVFQFWYNTALNYLLHIYSSIYIICNLNIRYIIFYKSQM